MLRAVLRGLISRWQVDKSRSCPIKNTGVKVGVGTDITGQGVMAIGRLFGVKVHRETGVQLPTVENLKEITESGQWYIWRDLPR